MDALPSKKLAAINTKLSKADAQKIAEARDKLNDKQVAFVHALMVPGTSQAQAAVNAGYSERSAHVTASRILRSTDVQDYIRTIMEDGFKVHALQSMGQMADLARTAKSDLVRFQANADILDRAGYKAVEKQAVAIQGQLKVNIDLS